MDKIYKHNSYYIRHLHHISSSNSFLKQVKKDSGLEHGTVILSDFQESGRGQSDHVWYSSPAKNLLTSIYLKPEITIKQHFFLTIITSLALTRVLYKRNFKVEIKWPNDIFLNGKKIAGILIENSLMGSQIEDTILGIGLNINEEIFPDYLPYASSLLIQGGIKHSPIDILYSILDEIDTLFAEFNANKQEKLFEEYKHLVFRKNQLATYLISGKTENAIIRDIGFGGELIMEMSDGSLKEFLFGDIVYQLEAEN